MIQPVKKLRILSLTVKGFKGFSEETAFTFGDLNTITGHNGQGKSSIADAIAFAITGSPFTAAAGLTTCTTKTPGTFPSSWSFRMRTALCIASPTAA